ncbi:MAG: transglutaminase family protein [Phycisphaerales bacterium]
MRRFVYRYINEKTLGVGFATASEVVRNRAGDCTEHAVLLAAMLRAEGIPSRGANGLIFIDQFGTGDKVFGYHMWTQALLNDADGRPVWEDFDASWPKAMDATHITTSVTDLGEDSMLDAYTTIARLLGVLAIEVESVE